MTSRAVERGLWLAAVVLVALALVVCLKRAAGDRAERDRANALETRLEELEARSAALRDSLARIVTRVGAELPEPRDVAALKRRGLDQPVAQLRADLVKHRELIPFPGAVGGTMAFHDPDRIVVLDDRWVMAPFDDGHVEGRMLLEYTVDRGRISWRRLAARMES